MKNNFPISISISLLVLLSCSPNKKTQETLETKSGKKDMYISIHRIAEVLPLTSQEAADFFTNLDSLHSHSFRNIQSQQFQYKAYTVFYEQPGKNKKLRGVGIDLDSTSHLSMEQLSKQLDAKWHIVDLIEVKAKRMHYTADYTDSKRNRKKIHITVRMASPENQGQNDVTFIGIDMEPEKKQFMD